MMNQTQRQELIDKYLQGSCTTQERDAVETWYLSRTEDTVDGLPEPDYVKLENEMWVAINNNTNVERSNLRLRRIFNAQVIRYMAAAILLLAVGSGIFIYLRQASMLPKIENNLAETIKPGSNRAYLTLANGKRIDLTNAKKGELAEQAGIAITKSSDGQLIYTVIERAVNEELHYNTIETPKGGQYQINLPDGTKVWLNANSSLRYPVSFAAQKERRVELLGEAYFEVAKNRELPFRVVSNLQTVEVLGTHFNINSYDDEPVTKTTLLEGSVKVTGKGAVGAKTLKPGEQTRMDGNSILVSNADVEADVDWKNGDFIFRDENIQSVMRKISRWYDVEVVYDGNVGQNGFGGTISRSKNIGAVLHVLEETGSVHFKLKGRRVTVTK